METVRGDVLKAVDLVMGNAVSVVVRKAGKSSNQVFIMSADECMKLGRELIAVAENAAAKGRKS